MNKLPTLYSRTSKGAVQQWTMFYDNTSYWTEYGQLDGKKIITEPYRAYSTNEGRANARNVAEQAEFEARALWTKKRETGYFESVDEIDDDYYIEPMLAQKYEDRMDELEFPVFSQPKLDGIRCVCTPTTMQSRNGKTFVSAPHILEQLAPFFEKYPDVILDGELYCDKFNDDFNKICSIVKKTKPTPADLKEAANSMQYWVYDIIDTTKTFSERIQFIQRALEKIKSKSIVCVPTHVCESFKDIDRHYEEYVNDGYEGQIVRVNAGYENKRSKRLLKRKEFQDKEYKIVSVNEGEGNKTGMAGNMTLESGDGRTFNSNIKGNRAFLKQLWNDRAELSGKKATVKYFNLTPDNIPRFPYVIAIRDYEG